MTKKEMLSRINQADQKLKLLMGSFSEEYNEFHFEITKKAHKSRTSKDEMAELMKKGHALIIELI